MFHFNSRGIVSGLEDDRHGQRLYLFGLRTSAYDPLPVTGYAQIFARVVERMNLC
jgi:hypothetical protein